MLSASEQNTHKQINKLGAKAKDTFDIAVQKTKTFAFPPIEVLKLANETKGVSENIFDYDSGDGTKFTVNDIVIYNNQLFLCIIKNTSTQEFEDDTDEWLLLSASEQNTHKQINKLGAKANDTFDIVVQKTKTFAFPPIEVLKLANETKGVSENIFDYDSSDGTKFTVDGVLASKSKFIIFDGTAHLNNIYDYNLEDYTRNRNYYNRRWSRMGNNSTNRNI